ncbi:MAG: glutamyl-tRNA reductase [Actinobacteria bacterium]|nr:glutamyl-tRNA reductase [Actinomycetota bacterium]
MTLIVVGVSHRSAPFGVLDHVALGESGVQTLLDHVVASDHVAEAMALSTCNRVEVYADVDRFHGAVDDIGAALAKESGLPVAELVQHLYVHYDERAIHHVFSVASGLDSMVVGESQILGQVRVALRTAQEVGVTGRTINELAQSALRVGKRVQSETTIHRHGASVVSVALDRAAEVLGGLAGRRAAIVGAGGMATLAISNLQAAGVAGITIANRTLANAEQLVAAAEPSGTCLAAVDMSELGSALADADVVVACTGASGTIIEVEHIQPRATPRVLLDLALPHDIATEVAEVPGAMRIDLAALADVSRRHSDSESAAVAIVDAETRAFVAAQAAASVEPIVVSLRSRADGILEREVSRLRLRLPQLDDAAAHEVERAMRRAMSSLLHTPTVRMKQMAADPDGERFTDAVRALFDLDPAAVQVISTPPEALDD